MLIEEFVFAKTWLTLILIYYEIKIADVVLKNKINECSYYNNHRVNKHQISFLKYDLNITRC